MSRSAGYETSDPRRTERLRRVGGILACLLLLICARGASGQTPEAQNAPPAPELQQIEPDRELADRLAVLEAALEAEAEAERRLEEAHAAQTEAEGKLEASRTALAEAQASSSKPVRAAAEQAVAAAEEAVAATAEPVTAAREALEQARADIATAQRLYDGAAERYRLRRESEEFENGRPGAAPEELRDSAVGAAFERRTQLDRAEQEAELARLRTAGLEAELDALLNRQERIQRSVAELDERLRARLARSRRGELESQRREFVEEERQLTERIDSLRRELLEAKVAQRIAEDDAAELAAAYTRWKRNLLAVAALGAGGMLLLWILRKVVARTVKEAHRRYQLNKILSFATTLVVAAGLVVIFAQDLKQLVTGLGLAIAGLAIALQEAVSSFFAWFLIRGANGYRTGDWIRIGGEEGEVVDIGWLVTVLEQAGPLDPSGETGGARTGGMAFVSNSALFKGSVVNYTRSIPFVWCAVSCTFTYESDWKLAERITREVLAGEKEIAASAQRARRDLEAAASELAVRQGSTEPRIRVRIAADGVELKIRFLAHPRRRRGLMDQVNRRILEAVQATPEVDFAYRTVRSVSSPTAAAGVVAEQ